MSTDPSTEFARHLISLGRALGMHGPVDARLMVAMVADAAERLAWMQGRRDAARRELCVALGELRGVGWSGRHIAVERGWGYLYPEDATACASCPGGGGRPHKLGCARRPGQGVRLNVGSPEPVAVVVADRSLTFTVDGQHHTYVHPEEPEPLFVVMCDACGEPIAAAEVETDFVDCGDITEVARVHARCRGIL